MISYNKISIHSHYLLIAFSSSSNWFGVPLSTDELSNDFQAMFIVIPIYSYTGLFLIIFSYIEKEKRENKYFGKHFES